MIYFETNLLTKMYLLFLCLPCSNTLQNQFALIHDFLFFFYCGPIALIVVRLVMSFTFVCGGIYGFYLNVICLGDCLRFAFFPWIRWLRNYGGRRLLTSILDWYATKLT